MGVSLIFSRISEHLEIPPFFFPPYNISKSHPFLPPPPRPHHPLEKATGISSSAFYLPLSPHSNPVHAGSNADHVTLSAVDFLPDLPLPSSLATGCSTTSVGFLRSFFTYSNMQFISLVFIMRKAGTSYDLIFLYYYYYQSICS